MSLSVETLALAKKFSKSYTDAVISGVAGGINYKGAVNYYSDLPNNPAQNDSYTVLYTGTSGNEPDGTQYVWTEYEGTLQWVAYGINRSLLKTYQTFRSTWTVNGTIKDFCDDVNADANAAEGMGYVGELTCSDLPFVGNADAVVEIVDGAGTSDKVIHIILTSGNVYPYRWEYTYWNNGLQVSGWIGTQPEVLTVIYTQSGNTITCNQEWQTISDALISNKPIQGWYVLNTWLVRAISKFVTSPSSASIQQISVRFNLTADGHGNCTETELTDRYNSSTNQRTISTVTVGHAVLPLVNASFNNYILGVDSGQWDKTTLGTIMSPNAQLSGNEPELTSLTIDGIKYKLPSSQDFYQAVSTASYGTPVVNP